MSRRLIAMLLVALPIVSLQLALSLRAQDAPKKEDAAKKEKGDAKPLAPGQRKVMKTDAEWAKLLTRNQFLVTRRKETEPAFSGKYAVSHAKGTFKCVCCGADLFSSSAKFDSGTGWPSFWKPIDTKNVETAADYELAEARIEVLCRDCGAHLGHVFNDGPPPTGLRFCINSASLKLVPANAAKTKAKASAKGKTSKNEAEPAPKSEKPESSSKEEKP